MKRQRVIAIAHKEFIQIGRDIRSLALAIAIPVMLLVLFGTALTLDVDNVPMVIWDQDHSKESRDFILNFSGSRYFKIVGYCDNYARIEEMIDKSQALMALVIPVNFSKLILANQPPRFNCLSMAPIPAQLLSLQLTPTRSCRVSMFSLRRKHWLVSESNSRYFLKWNNAYGLIPISLAAILLSRA
jgi:hypothetical protein